MFVAIKNQSETYLQKTQLLANSASAFYFSKLTTLEAISAVLSTILFIAVIYLVIKTGWLTVRVNRWQDVLLKTNLSKKETQKTWGGIQKHFFAGNDNDLKIAILEADKLLDEALRGAGIQGNTLGDRLKKVKPSQLPDIDAIWQAHKVRNQIAHESDFKLKRDLAERALGVYEKTLRGLELID